MKGPCQGQALKGFLVFSFRSVSMLRYALHEPARARRKSHNLMRAPRPDMPADSAVLTGRNAGRAHARLSLMTCSEPSATGYGGLPPYDVHIKHY